MASTVTYLNGLPNTETEPLATGENLVETYTRDAAGNPLNCTWNYPIGADYAETFTYDGNGDAIGSTFRAWSDIDIVTLSAAKSSAANKRPGALAVISGRLRRALVNVVPVILGDPTDNDVDEWVRLVAVALGSRYPKYTVLLRIWNAADLRRRNHEPDRPTGRTLTIYNGSTPGVDAAYSST